MSYSSKELSASDGSPFELFLFELGGNLFPYTSQSSSYTYLSNVYQPLEIARDNPRLNEERSGQQLTIRVPYDSGPAVLFIDVVPSARMNLTIFRGHRTDGGSPEIVTFWKGFVTNVNYKGQVAEMVGVPLQSLFGREIPRQTFQSLCNHVLYDTGCGINKALFSDMVTVDTISSGGSVLVLDSLSGARPADTTFYKGGFIERANGDKRLIMDYTFGTDTVRILLPFQDLEIGETVTARAGCNRTMDACKDKFSNVLRFDGFITVPGSDPFSDGFI